MSSSSFITCPSKKFKSSMIVSCEKVRVDIFFTLLKHVVTFVKAVVVGLFQRKRFIRNFWSPHFSIMYDGVMRRTRTKEEACRVFNDIYTREHNRAEELQKQLDVQTQKRAAFEKMATNLSLEVDRLQQQNGKLQRDTSVAATRARNTLDQQLQQQLTVERVTNDALRSQIEAMKYRNTLPQDVIVLQNRVTNLETALKMSQENANRVTDLLNNERKRTAEYQNARINDLLVTKYCRISSHYKPQNVYMATASTAKNLHTVHKEMERLAQQRKLQSELGLPPKPNEVEHISTTREYDCQIFYLYSDQLTKLPLNHPLKGKALLFFNQCQHANSINGLLPYNASQDDWKIMKIHIDELYAAAFESRHRYFEEVFMFLSRLLYTLADVDPEFLDHPDTKSAICAFVLLRKVIWFSSMFYNDYRKEHAHDYDDVNLNSKLNAVPREVINLEDDDNENLVA